MNRLRIVVEGTEPEVWEVVYCGTDRAKAEEALHDPTSNPRAMFVKPSPSARNRPLPKTTPEDKLSPAKGVSVFPAQEEQTVEFKPAPVTMKPSSMNQTDPTPSKPEPSRPEPTRPAPSPTPTRPVPDSPKPAPAPHKPTDHRRK